MFSGQMVRISADPASSAPEESEDRDTLFELVYTRYRRRIYNYALRFLGDLQEAEEATQDVFIRAYRYLGRFQGGRDRLQAWIYRIAYTVLADRVKTPWWRWGRYRRDTDGVDLPSGGGSPEVLSSERQTARRVARTLRKLPDRQRAALLMFVFDGLSQADIAAGMGLKENHVKVLIHRARTFLTRALEGERQ